MAKHVTKIVKKPSSPQHRIEVSDGVRASLAGLNQTEKAAIEAALRSGTALRRLPVQYVVKAPSGDLRTARVTDDLCLVYRIEPTVIRITDLLSFWAVRYLVDPRWMARSGQMRPPKPQKQLKYKRTTHAPAGS